MNSDPLDPLEVDTVGCRVGVDHLVEPVGEPGGDVVVVGAEAPVSDIATPKDDVFGVCDGEEALG